MILVKGERTAVLTAPVWIAVFKANGYTEAQTAQAAATPAKAKKPR